MIRQPEDVGLRPHRGSPATAPIRQRSAIDPSLAQFRATTTRSSAVFLAGDHDARSALAIVDRSTQASAQPGDTAPAASIQPMLRASCAERRDNVPDRGSAAGGCNCVHAAPRVCLDAIAQRCRLAPWLPPSYLVAGESSSDSFAHARSAVRPPLESLFLPARRTRARVATGAAARGASLRLLFRCGHLGPDAGPVGSTSLDMCSALRCLETPAAAPSGCVENIRLPLLCRPFRSRVPGYRTRSGSASVTGRR